MVTVHIHDRGWYAGSGRPIDALEVKDYQQLHNHFCTVFVKYADGEEKSLIGRVVYNDIKEKWTVDALFLAVTIEGWKEDDEQSIIYK